MAQKTDTVYEEIQSPSPSLSAFMILIILFVFFNMSSPTELAIVLLIVTFLYVLFGFMTIHLTRKHLKIRYGFVGILNKSLPLSEIKSVRSITYQVWKMGGWGMRGGFFENNIVGGITIGGNRGVLITNKTGQKFFRYTIDSVIIGSKHPEKLKVALVKLLPIA